MTSSMMFPRGFGPMPPAIPAGPMPQSCIHSQPLAPGCRFVTFGRRTGRHMPSRNTSALTLHLFGPWTAWLAAAAATSAGMMFLWAKEMRRYTASEVREVWASATDILLAGMAAGMMFLWVKEMRRYTASEVREVWASSKQLPPPRDLKDRDKLIPHLMRSCCGASIASPGPEGKVLLLGTEGKSPDFELKMKDVPSGCRGGSASQVLQGGESRKEFEEDLKKILAKAHGVDPSSINITEIKEGSVEIRYTIGDQTFEKNPKWMEMMKEVERKLIQEVDTFDNFMVILPTLGFDINDWDHAGDKKIWEGREWPVGPSGNKRTYQQPKAEQNWVRYGIKVDCGPWLAPFLDERNWWRAFHGMRRPLSSAHPIHEEGFQPSKEGLYGKGVYVSPDIEYAATYAYSVEVEMITGKVDVQVAYQVAVKPGSADEHDGPGHDPIWVIKDPQNVRPYGMLVREV